MIHSGNKGKRFERKIAVMLSDWTGLPMGRTPMSGAWTKEPGDIVCLQTGEGFPFSVECKHWENWNLDNVFHFTGHFPAWVAQMAEEAEAKSRKENSLYWPMLIFTRNRRPIYIMLPEEVVNAGGHLTVSHIVLKSESWGQFVVGEAINMLKDISYSRILEYHGRTKATSYPNITGRLNPQERLARLKGRQ